MAEQQLTKNYFDKGLKDIKEHVKQEVKGLRGYIEVKFDDLNARTARGFTDIQERLNVKEEIEKLKRDNRMIKQALNLPA